MCLPWLVTLRLLNVDLSSWWACRPSCELYNQQDAFEKVEQWLPVIRLSQTASPARLSEFVSQQNQ